MVKVKNSRYVHLIPKLTQDASIVGIKNNLGKALIVYNSHSIVQINNAVFIVFKPTLARFTSTYSL
ncbi:hypothetical protein PspMM1_11050 [Pseudoalteromonas sp. MM1]|jgi:hypothetical protein|nr:hypothetical protein PspMM1_11050 [Pseudoalteromonas sp. MM1]